VGDALQDAQRTLAGDRLRELSAQRRQVIAELLPVAAALAVQAGQPASPAVLEEVRATLEAAVADADARAAVRSGRLTKALAYAGLGEVDLTAAVAIPNAGARQRPAAGTSRPGGSAGPRREARGSAEPGPAEAPAAAAVPTERDPAARAAEAVAAAESAAAHAAGAGSAADSELTAISEQRQFLRRRIRHLEGELAQTKEEDARLAGDAQRAEQTRDAAARDLGAAERRLGRARRDQAAHSGPD
jgi:hypothetical protein